MTYLTSGSLMTIPERRQALVERMAADLAGSNVPDRGDAIRLLCGKGYSIVSVHCLVDDVRAVAFQDLVAKEMSAS